MLSILWQMSFDSIWQRIASETDLQKPGQLADIVGTTRQYVSRKKKENSFPIEWAYKVAKHYGLLTEWVFSGEGPKRIPEDKKYEFKVLKDLDTWLSEVVVSNPDRRQWFSVMIYDTFPMFSEWVKRREEEDGKDSNSAGRNVA